MKLFVTWSLGLLAILTTSSQATTTSETNFLAFGDGGYHVDYPKTKHINKPKDRRAFLVAEIEDWLAIIAPWLTLITHLFTFIREPISPLKKAEP